MSEFNAIKKTIKGRDSEPCILLTFLRERCSERHLKSSRSVSVSSHRNVVRSALQISLTKNCSIGDVDNFIYKKFVIFSVH